MGYKKKNSLVLINTHILLHNVPVGVRIFLKLWIRQTFISLAEMDDCHVSYRRLLLFMFMFIFLGVENERQIELKKRKAMIGSDPQNNHKIQQYFPDVI